MAEETTPLRRSSRIRDVSKTPKSRSRSPTKRTRAVSPEKAPKLSNNGITHSDLPLEWGSDTFWRIIYVYWPMILVAGTVAAAVVVPPPEFALRAGRKMGMQEPTVAGLVLSPIFLLCALLLVAGVYFIERCNLPLRKASSTEKMIAYWHLSNAAWWSFGCDVISGLFGAMPNMSILYLAVDSKHTKGVMARSALDAVYWSELTVHVPLSWLCFFLYLRQSPGRRVVESFLSGVQLLGTIAYYLPEILEAIHRGTFQGGHWPWEEPVLFALGIGFGLMWIIFPVILLARSFSMER